MYLLFFGEVPVVCGRSTIYNPRYISYQALKGALHNEDSGFEKSKAFCGIIKSCFRNEKTIPGLNFIRKHIMLQIQFSLKTKDPLCPKVIADLFLYREYVQDYQIILIHAHRK